MRLHRLSVTAFGPFGGTQEVDFGELSAAGLFLLHGPTGAGKTSVLDAVCYALYGQVPGARQGSGPSLRSDHADPFTPTEVVLELTVGERRLEITRSPEQPRPKKRGTGTTREKAQSLLREFVPGTGTGLGRGTGEWKALSRSHQEIGEEIGQLLGMSREQFCQVVLLPQGEFARFLRADEMARGKLLGRLFDTGRFAAVEERLAELRRAAEKRVVGGDERLLALAHRMAQAAGPAPDLAILPLPELAPGEPGLADAVLEWAAVARTGAREQRDIALAAVRAAEAAHDAARRAADAERERAQLQHRHTEARRRADHLERQRAEHDMVRRRLERARAADAVVPALELRASAEHEHRAAVSAERAARAHLAAEPDLDALTATLRRPAPRPADPGRPDIPGQRPPGEGEFPARSVAAADGAQRSAGAPCEGVRDGRADARPSNGTPNGGGDAAGAPQEPASAARSGDDPPPDGGDQRSGGATAADAPVSTDVPAQGAHLRGQGSTSADRATGGSGSSDARRHGEAAEPRVPGPAPHGPTASAVDGDRGPSPLSEADAASLARVERWLREELGSLAAARRGERQAEALAEEIAGLDREARADDDTHAEAADWLAGWETVRAAHQRRIETAQEAATRAEQLAGRIESAGRRLDAARLRDRLAGETEEARENRLRCREDAAAAQRTWLDLKERRLRGIAAELAAGLRAGEPCAVCGSAEHPDPARPDAGHVDRAAEETALEEYQRAEARREEAERVLHGLREALAGAEATAEGGDAGELARAVAEVRSAFAEARDAAADAHPAREALDRAEREYERRLAQRQEAERRASGRTSRREVLLRERTSLLTELEQARGGAATVAERAGRLERQAGLLARAAEAALAAESAAGRLKEADARLADAAYRAGFDTPQAASGAVLPPERQREARLRIERWQTESAAVAAELADAHVLAAAQAPPADPEAAHAAAEAATRALRDASAADAAARARCADLDALSEQAVADARRIAPLREEYDRVARLATLTAGTAADNERKMRLEAYVLAARLEQVAAAASVRLARMSCGRYTLVHSDARSSGRGRSGLGLHVIDAWTGRERDTATLSGGETFFASLALALGLSDVVTDEAGGVRLDTLFIDEGFGSLDEQTLDEVLDVLDSLRERDRTVAIVSHVADLRQRIPARLEVVKTRRGSTLHHHTTAGA
ncbi:AAA family ATPase [Streptomyces sp. NA02950]|uniref:AAA family ATPase n=1 Tax=Streptomyces sp. NA02950 TaxID=2742137 RepID=UPI00159294E8|nr:AAA family ATPase [Streptomyces sp. NA02950]QKV91221.1 AAA family ATPase [Streptomyces sp. NA02950]